MMVCIYTKIFCTGITQPPRLLLRIDFYVLNFDCSNDLWSLQRCAVGRTVNVVGEFRKQSAVHLDKILQPVSTSFVTKAGISNV